MTKEIWIVKGTVTDASVYDSENVTNGQVEYQFSDGPAGQRTSSADYIDLEEGLKDFSGFIIHFEK